MIYYKWINKKTIRLQIKNLILIIIIDQTILFYPDNMQNSHYSVQYCQSMLLSVIKQSPRYYSKNFYKQIGLSTHFTLKGFLLRTRRQFPTLYMCTKFAFIFFSVTSTSMLLINGSMLPFQGQVKSTAMGGIERMGRIWYLNSLHTKKSNIIGYINFVFSLIQYAFENNLQNSDIIPYYLSLINNCVQNRVNNIKKSERNSILVYQINYSVMVLRKLFEEAEGNCLKTKKCIQILKNKEFFWEYKRITQNIKNMIGGNIENMNDSWNQIEEKDKRKFESVFLIYEYLLKFSEREQKMSILNQIVELLREKRMKFMCEFLEKQAGQFKAELKKLYKQDTCLQPYIMKIIHVVDENRIEQAQKAAAADKK